MDKLSICAGQPDNHYIKMVSAKRGLLKSQGGSTIADVDDYATVRMNGYLFSKTIRTNKCELLIHGVKCNSCTVVPLLRDHCQIRQQVVSQEGWSFVRGGIINVPTLSQLAIIFLLTFSS